MSEKIIPAVDDVAAIAARIKEIKKEEEAAKSPKPPEQASMYDNYGYPY